MHGDGSTTDEVQPMTNRRSVAQRVAGSGDGGREIGGGAGGSAIPQNDWENGEYHDASQAKSGQIDPSEGEMYFMADEENRTPHSDRNYRSHDWAPPKDSAAVVGQIVDMPYATS